MTRIEIASEVGATNLSPIDYTYTRVTQEGIVPVTAYLVGTHFNERKDGIVSLSSTTNSQNASINVSGGKLSIVGDSDGVGDINVSKATISASHSTYMYFWPKTQIHGNSELTSAQQVGEYSAGNVFTLKMRTKFTDLISGHELCIDLDAGNSASSPTTLPNLNLREIKNGITTTLATVYLPVGESSIDWQLIFLDEGVTKFSYKTNSALPILLWKGDLSVKMSETFVNHELVTNVASTTHTVKTDFFWVFYKSIFSSYDSPKGNTGLANVSIYDTLDRSFLTQDLWREVYSKDHKFTGERVVQNGIIRIWFKADSTIQVSCINPTDITLWNVLGSIKPVSSTGVYTTELLDVIFSKYNSEECVITAKFGSLTYEMKLRKGMPHVRIIPNSKKFTFACTKPRFALSAKTEDVNLLDYNQKYSDDSQKGNPLNLAVPETTSTFIEGGPVARNLANVDDNWFAFYELNSPSSVAWIGTLFIPTTLEVEASNSASLKEARFGFRQEPIVTVGMLNGDPVTTYSGVPKIFFAQTEDNYVKWRANASLFEMAQSPFVGIRR